MRLTPIVALCLAFAACKSPPPDTPDAAYRAFLQSSRDAHEGKSPKKFLEAFDASTQAALSARAKAASHQTGDNLPDDATYQMFLGDAAVPAVSVVKILDQSADAATLEVDADAGSLGQVKMVREGGKWRIHLDALDLVSDAGH